MIVDSFYVLLIISWIIFPSKSYDGSGCMNGHILPKLFIIGSQKGGTSSLYADIKSVQKGMVTSTACRFRHDPKECNVFVAHSTLASLFHSFGKEFCKEGGTTANYCTRIRSRGFQTSSFFISQYDSCNVSTKPCTDMVVVNDGNNECIPIVPVDASPTYSTRPHVPGTIRNVYGTLAFKLRFVLTIRDPVKRTISYYNHAMQNNWANLQRRKRKENLTFREWIIDELKMIEDCLNNNAIPQRINKNISIEKAVVNEYYTKSIIDSNNNLTMINTVDRTHDIVSEENQRFHLEAWPDCGILGITTGLYSLQLKHWFQYFNPSQFLIVSFDDTYGSKIKETTSYLSVHNIVLKTILEFVGVPKHMLEQSEKKWLSSQPVGLKEADTASNTIQLKPSKHASFSHHGHDKATNEDLIPLELFFSPYNQKLCALLDAKKVKVAPDWVTPHRLVQWGY